MAPTTALFMLPIDALRCYDLVLIAVLMLALDAAMLAWNGRGQQLSPTELALLRQYNEHVAVVNRLNSVETFVEQSKAIRRMNAVKKQMQELAVERLQKAAPSNLQKRINQVRTPLVALPQGYLVPLERLLALPGFPFGSVSAVGWAVVCRRVGTKLLG
ncbi:hypothetical protein PybrP1_008207 [[Pythium] brassicae (nom. inval.)]|nr:hypothetical protein PybrP1_008207 [[Pythium] brassicae (nom. inval.)]